MRSKDAHKQLARTSLSGLDFSYASKLFVDFSYASKLFGKRFDLLLAEDYHVEILSKDE